MTKINILRGNHHQPPTADFNVIIDVLRAFTTTFYAFQKGMKEIYLVNEVEKGFQLKSELKNALVAGEIGGYKIEGFDFGNSPHEIMSANFTADTLILKTSNGVKATLNCLDAKAVFVTGFVNIDTLAHFLKKEITTQPLTTINIIASDPESDDDFACAEYLAGCLLQKNQINKKECQARIASSKAAMKFTDATNEAFEPIDLALAMEDISADFLMKVHISKSKTKLLKHDYIY